MSLKKFKESVGFKTEQVGYTMSNRIDNDLVLTGADFAPRGWMWRRTIEQATVL